MIYGLAKHLPKGKFRITILQPTSPCSSFKQYDGSDEKIRVIHLPSFFLPKTNYTIPLFLKQLRTLSKLGDYDIIQVGDYFYPTSMLPLILNRHRKNPRVLSVNALPGYSWQFGSVFVDLVAKGYTYSLGKQILSCYDKVVALYNKLSEDLRRVGVPSRKICVIPNGVDSDRFQNVDQAYVRIIKKRLSIRDEEKVILFVGRLSKVKRVELVIRLTRSLIQEGYSIKTVIVGDGPYRKSYERLIEPSNNKIIFTGWISPVLIPVYYALADVVVLPSLSEGLPNVLLEASAAGKPIVATNVGGVSDIVLHGKTGFLVNRMDFDSFCEFTQLILNDPNLQEELGHNAITYVKKKFNWQTIIKKYQHLYEELLCL